MTCERKSCSELQVEKIEKIVSLLNDVALGMQMDAKYAGGGGSSSGNPNPNPIVSITPAEQTIAIPLPTNSGEALNSSANANGQSAPITLDPAAIAAAAVAGTAGGAGGANTAGGPMSAGGGGGGGTSLAEKRGHTTLAINVQTTTPRLFAKPIPDPIPSGSHVLK